MNYKTAALLIIFSLLFLPSCFRREKPPVPNANQLLSNGSHKDWILESVTYQGLSVIGRIPDCQQDEIYRFYSDGTGEVRSGSVPCDPQEPIVQTTGAWQLLIDGRTLLINWKDGKNWRAYMDELRPDKLEVTGIVYDNYEVTATFRPI